MKVVIAGIVLSLMGSIPPGLISLTVAQTAFRRGFLPAVILAAGAAFAEFFQAWFAAVFTGWFVQHPGVERWFQWGAFPIFLGLGVYLLFFARPPRPPEEIQALTPFRQFAKGVVVSVFNLLAIPYWFVYCGWLRLQGYWIDGWWGLFGFSAGVMVGTGFALALYAWLGGVILRRSDAVARYINWFVGLIFLAIALQTLWKLVEGG